MRLIWFQDFKSSRAVGDSSIGFASFLDDSGGAGGSGLLEIPFI